MKMNTTFDDFLRKDSVPGHMRLRPRGTAEGDVAGKDKTAECNLGVFSIQ